MRSTVFITLSLIVHVICIAALALNHFKNAASVIENAVEVTLGDATNADQVAGGAAPEAIQAAESAPPAPVVEVSKPEVKETKPAPIVAAAPPVAPPPAPAPKVKKVAKPVPVAAASKLPADLPAKPNNNSEPAPPNMDPAIDDSDAVAVVAPTPAPAPPAEQKSEPVQQEEPPKFIPVKEKVAAGVEASPTSEQKTTEQKDSKETTGGKTAAIGGADGGTSTPLGQGGDTKAEAVSYLKLRQLGGNRAPDYPISARKEQRQGMVGLVYRVTTEGRVADVQIEKSSGHPDLDEAAANAISKFKFAPGQEGWCKHPVIFTLKGVAAALPSKLRTSTHAAAD